MADPCPSCDSQLSLDNSFCKECGYDVDLAVAEWQGEGAEIPEDDDAAYQDFLRREGLGEGGTPTPWGTVVGVAGLIALLLLWLVIR